MTSRHYCFTVNNPDAALHPDIDWLPKGVRYAVYQLELGDNLTHHYQGYLELARSQRMSWVKKLPGLERAHLEIRRGTREQARDYCMKDESRVEGPWEYGNFATGGQGKRTDVLELKNVLLAGATERQILEQLPQQWFQYQRAISYTRTMLQEPRSWNTDIHLYIGTPGSGKSAKVMREHPDAYWKQRSNWWDNYTGQEVVVLDDFYGWLPPDMIFRLGDRYPLLVETKGGQRQFLAKKLIITSNKAPVQWWNSETLGRIDIQALYRRIKKVIRFDGQFDPERPDHNYVEYDSWDSFAAYSDIPLPSHIPTRIGAFSDTFVLPRRDTFDH